MTESFFIKTHCPRCGTQSCYGTVEDLPYCGTWNKIKTYPNEMYETCLKRIERREQWRRKHYPLFNKRFLKF